MNRLLLNALLATGGLQAGESYTYRCILTNDYETSAKDIVEFYNMRGGKERILDEMNNGFGWNGHLRDTLFAQSL